MKVSPNFDLEELVPPETYQKYGSSSIWFIDKKIIEVLEIMRKDLGPIYVNTWSLPNPKLLGQIFNYSGYRPPECKEGASASQHRFGRAADIKSLSHSSDEIRGYIKGKFKVLNASGLTTIEKDTQGWVHFDCRWSGNSELFEVPFQ